MARLRCHKNPCQRLALPSAASSCSLCQSSLLSFCSISRSPPTLMALFPTHHPPPPSLSSDNGLALAPSSPRRPSGVQMEASTLKSKKDCVEAKKTRASGNEKGKSRQKGLRGQNRVGRKVEKVGEKRPFRSYLDLCKGLSRPVR